MCNLHGKMIKTVINKNITDTTIWKHQGEGMNGGSRVGELRDEAKAGGIRAKE